MRFERHREVGFGLQKASYKQLGVPVEAENLKLNGVHERVEKSPFGQSFVEDHDVDECKGFHVGDFGKVVKALGSSVGIEVGSGDPLPLEFDDANVVEERGREVGPHAGFVLVAKRPRARKIVGPLLA